MLKGLERMRDLAERRKDPYASSNSYELEIRLFNEIVEGVIDGSINSIHDVSGQIKDFIQRNKREKGLKFMDMARIMHMLGNVQPVMYGYYRDYTHLSPENQQPDFVFRALGLLGEALGWMGV